MKKEFIVIDNRDMLRQYASDDLLYISSDGDYCDFVLINGNRYKETIQLGQVQKMLVEQLPLTGWFFARVGRKHIINLTYLNYINQLKRQLVLLDRNLNKVELNVIASSEVLDEFKNKIKLMNEAQKTNKK